MEQIKGKHRAFAELLTYLTESMPQPQPGSIKSYIEAIADIKIEESKYLYNSLINIHSKQKNVII